LKILTAITKLS